MENENGRIISDMVNKSSFSPIEVAQYMANDHRYLQGEFFKLCEFFIAILANNYEKGIYDGRNEYACKCAKTMIDALCEQKLLDKDYIENYILNGKAI